MKYIKALSLLLNKNQACVCQLTEAINEEEALDIISIKLNTPH